MTASRKPNPWMEAALEFGRAHKGFVALDPRTTPKSWAAWRDYFRWLNWAPYWFCHVETLHDERPDSQASWTAPIDHPDKFTVAFQPIKGPPPVFPLTRVKQAIGPLPGHVDRLRREGKLTFGEADDLKSKPWFKALTKMQAQTFLDKHEEAETTNDQR